MRRILTALAIAAATATLQPALAADTATREADEKVVYAAAIDQKDLEAASRFMGRFRGDSCIQHVPLAASGPEGLEAYFAFLRENDLVARSEIERVLAEETS